MSQTFLSDIRVLDLSQFLPGPFATQMLADMGADVVKVEPPKGDPMRMLDPVTNDRGPSPYHALVNAGKRVVTLDLKSDDGRQAFQGRFPFVAASRAPAAAATWNANCRYSRSRGGAEA